MISPDEARKESLMGEEKMYRDEIKYVNKKIKEACKEGRRVAQVVLEPLTKNLVVTYVEGVGYTVNEDSFDLFTIRW